jgi:hypothetical protein
LQREMFARAAEEKEGKSRWFGRQRKEGERIGGELVCTVRISHQIRFIVLTKLLRSLWCSESCSGQGGLGRQRRRSD